MSDENVSGNNTQEQQTQDQQTLVEPVPTGRPRRVLLWLGSGFILILILIAATFFAIPLPHPDGESSDNVAGEPKKERQLSAIEIITQEFAGKIELGHEPPLGASSNRPGMFVAEHPPDSERTPSSVMAGTANSIALQFSLNRKATQVSKGLNKKKVLKYLDERLSKTVHCGSVKDTKKSVKAVIKISKAGRIEKIHVVPKEHQNQIAQCLKKKLGPSASAFKASGKSKTLAQITLELKPIR